MNGFRDGVAYYTTGTVEIYSPEGETVCRHCILLKDDYKLDRAICLRTGEIIPAPDYMRGRECPVKLEEPVF